jgi:hypothetical protein
LQTSKHNAFCYSNTGNTSQPEQAVQATQVWQTLLFLNSVIVKTGKNAGKSEKGKTFWFFQVISFPFKLKITPEIEKVKILAWF